MIPKITMMQRIFYVLLISGFLAGTNFSVYAQEPQPDPQFTPATPDCSLYIQDPGVPTSLYSGSADGEIPHLMPPHPDLLDCVEQGKATIPQILADSELKAQAGLDQPLGTEAASAAGTFRTLAILVKFSDKNSQVGATSFDSLLFGSATGTMPDYYDKASYGILDIVTVNLPSTLGTLGWLTMPRNYTYYVGSGYGFEGAFPNNAQKLAADAARAADPLVNFANYDNNNDGRVDTIFVVHAGRGAEFTGSKTDIWSHSWVTNPADRPTLDGKQIYSYTTEPEYWQSPGDMTVGVFAHELGHVLGLPDLYDTDSSSRGIGRWSLMASGSWNGQSNLGGSPAFPDAWSRIALGWVVPTAVNSHTFGQSIPAVATSPSILKLKPTSGNTNEYFLVENRQKTLYDTYLPIAGLLVWHIDENRNNNDAECLNLNNWNCQNQHFKVALEQADGLLNLEYKINSGDLGDVFPGSGNRRSFTFSTSPNNSSYFSSSNPAREIFRISDSGPIMSADFYIGAYDHSFSKSTPFNTGTKLPNNISLTWGSSLGAYSYEYCLDTTADSSCSTSWSNTGTNQYVPLNNLSSGVTYFWQVRSLHAHGTTDANSSTWWSFTIQSQQSGNFSIFLPFLTR